MYDVITVKHELQQLMSSFNNWDDKKKHPAGLILIFEWSI